MTEPVLPPSPQGDPSPHSRLGTLFWFVIFVTGLLQLLAPNHGAWRAAREVFAIVALIAALAVGARIVQMTRRGSSASEAFETILFR